MDELPVENAGAFCHRREQVNDQNYFQFVVKWEPKAKNETKMTLCI